MLTTQFNHLDATFLNIDRRPETWSVHVEVRVSGHISSRRLSYALRAAVQRHPLARARLQHFEGNATRYFWEFPSDLDHLPLTVLEARHDEDVIAIRNRFVSIQVPLTLAPCFMVYLVHHSQGDYLMLNVPHTLADGLSSFRLMQSILRIYAEQADPIPEVNTLEVRDLQALAGSKSTAQRMERARLLIDHLAKSTVAPARIAAKGIPAGDADKRPGYGVEFLRLSAGEAKTFMSRREKPATVNDQLLAAMALTIKDWNASLNTKPGRIAIMMPVNLRPQDWWHDVFSNFSSYVSVSLTPEEQGDLGSTTSQVCKQTTAFKEAGAAGTLIDLLEIPRFLPAFLKARLKELFPLFGKQLMETTWVSNLGKLSAFPTLGDAGEVTALYFTPPAPMPCSIAVGIACMNDELLLGLRYRKSQFDAKSIAQFAALLKQTMVG
jgi:NRPS condensation-like uncharacterized protein